MPKHQCTLYIFFAIFHLYPVIRIVKEGLALQTYLAVVREGKRKRGVRNFSVTSMAKSISPEKVEHLHVTDSESPQGTCSFMYKVLCGSVILFYVRLQ